MEGESKTSLKDQVAEGGQGAEAKLVSQLQYRGPGPARACLPTATTPRPLRPSHASGDYLSICYIGRCALVPLRQLLKQCRPAANDVFVQALAGARWYTPLFLSLLISFLPLQDVVEPRLFQDLDLRSSKQLLSLGRTLACKESGCIAKVAEWTRSVTFGRRLFALKSRNGLNCPHHKDESAAAQHLLRSARRLRSLVLPVTGYHCNHRLLAIASTATALLPLKHLSVTVHGDLLGCMGQIASMVHLEELTVSVWDGYLPPHDDDFRDDLTTELEITSWNLPVLRTLSLDLRELYSDYWLTEMMSFLSRCTLARLQEFELHMHLDETSTLDLKITQRFCRFLAHHRRIMRVSLDPGHKVSIPWNGTWQTITSSTRAPTLALAQWFDPSVIDGLADEVKTLEITSIDLGWVFGASDFSTPFPMLDMCVARAASGALRLRKIVLELSPIEKVPRTLRQTMRRVWKAQRLEAYTIYGALFLAYAARLCRAGIRCDIDQVLAGKPALIIWSHSQPVIR
jgi:hypothetical protein